MNQDITTVVDSETIKDGKLIALLAHFWIVGTVISWVINLSKKNEFSAFYIRQMIGYQVLVFLTEGIVLSVFGKFIAWLLGMFLLLFWFLSLFGAVSGKLKLMPVIGAYFQKIFRSL